MTLDELFEGSWFIYFIIVVWLVSSAFIIFLLGQIDSIVHGKLYDFGLNFSYSWAVPYWGLFRLIYICLLFPAVLSIFTICFSLYSWFRGRKSVPVVRVREEVGEAVEEKVDSMIIACSYCGKRFSRPILMLDFSGGKTRLVNVCPFCGAKLGENNQVKDKDFEIRISNTKKELTKQSQ